MNARKLSLVAGGAVALSAVVATAQPVMDGQRDAVYGGALAVQTNATGFGNSGDSNCDPNDIGNPADVVTGIEIAIPLSELGSPAGAIKLFAAVNGGGHDFLSNQVLGSLPLGTPNLGEPRSVNFNSFTGNQFAAFTPAAGAAPTIDGVLDASYVRVALQANQTGFGDASTGLVDSANGSEADALYAVVSGGELYIFFAGNLETNFNKFELFFDTETGGQNKLRGDNVDIDFNGLNRMGDDGSGNGMTFDTGFDADYWFSCTNGGSPTTLYANFASLNFGYGDYQGSTSPGSDGTLSGGTSYGIRATIDNSNTEGVPGYCKPFGTEEYANGSELDALYGHVDTANNRLYVLLTGNLENGAGAFTSNSGNKIHVLLDTQPGGQNRLRGDNVDISYGNLNLMGDDGSGNGLTFDTGFEPDYWASVKINNFPVYQILDAAVLRTNGRLRDLNGNSLDYGAYDRNPIQDHIPIPFAGPLLDIQDGFTPNLYCNYGPRLTNLDPFNPVNGLLGLSSNNSNTGGVSGSDPSGGASVTTGFELSFDLDEIGWDGTSPIKVSAFISGENADYLSNQFLPGLPAGTSNLGNAGATRTINLGAYAGTQWVEIPTSDPCDYADFNGNGTVNTADVSAFLNAWVVQRTQNCSGGGCSADCNGSGTVNTQDVTCFLNLWTSCR